MMNQRQFKGFSLLELMIVLTILAIIAILSIPSYLKYIQRAYLAEPVSILGNYKTALGVYWNTNGYLPATGSTLQGSPADLNFGTATTTNLPDSIQSILLSNSGNGSLVTIVVNDELFPTLSQTNRQIVLGAKTQGNQIVFECGNFTPNSTAATDSGFPDRTMLPSNCNYNGVGTWLSS